MSKETGGYAFPGGSARQGNPARNHEGMTMRDWFAGQALSGYLAAFGHFKNINMDVIASEAYRVADAVLKVRES